ncbi:cupin [Burkholderia ubonensis]|uniref:cupin domain-containing protein n=1 Tax=Burkholderia ubonensis TaxID=101571 RepID=UPI000755BD40|nr:cupin domain-containing protein [Burkholderia ubonensis]KWE50640.1 cupin [Burkholderia ubonensis]
MTRNVFMRAAACAALVLGSTMSAAHAHDGGGGSGDGARPVMKQAVPEAPGKLVLVATVDYAPGQASEPHRHLGSVFAVVSKSEVLSQVNDGPLRRYRAGEGWYEPPGSRHLVSRNGSDTEPAQIVVFGLTGENAPLKSAMDH